MKLRDSIITLHLIVILRESTDINIVAIPHLPLSLWIAFSLCKCSTPVGHCVGAIGPPALVLVPLPPHHTSSFPLPPLHFLVNTNYAGLFPTDLISLLST
ncbi:hypothetical protein PanWU01x14_226560 [Parasponia andersonii]|uniref:Uncharacterized protein n=1 Tax=Parasponia andersonii TaxID=3476 RepID=A0A2P5BMJ4_PARAD|nr:hypothetical protein PanWU01x14_226560 [Parasponia andersonii]